MESRACSEFNSRYKQYKQATEDFLAWLRKADKGLGTKPTIAAIEQAIQNVRKKKMRVPVTTILNLTASIRLRSETSVVIGPDRDEEHVFFLSFLRRCKSSLLPLCEEKKDSKVTVKAETVDKTTNRFSSLQLSDDEEEEVDEGGNLREMPPPLPTPSSVQSLYNTSDRFPCLCFLLDMHELFGYVVKAWRDYKKGTLSIIAASAVTNACVKRIQTLFSLLQLEFPYITEFQHLFLIVFLSDVLDWVRTMHPRINTREKVVRVCYIASMYVPGHEENIISRIVGTEHMAREDAEDLMHMVLSNWSERADDFFGWSEHMGRAQDIIWTAATLNGLIEMINRNVRLTAREGFFGRRFDERKKLAKDFTDLHDLLMADIMPSLMVSGFQVENRHDKRVDMLFPLVPMMAEFVETKKTSVPLIFAIHSMLLAVINVQGNGDFERIIPQTKACLQTLFGSIESYIDFPMFRGHPSVLLSATAGHNHLSFFVKHRDTQCTKAQQDRAFYNPWMAGQHLLLSSCLHSLYYGAHPIDGLGQTRIVLHLYNAFRHVKLIENPIPLFETLTQVFSRCPVLWEGGKPEECGSFTKGFLLSWGHGLQNAGDLAMLMRRSPSYFENVAEDHEEENGAGRSSKLKNISPFDLSPAYVRIHGDFTGIDGVKDDFGLVIQELRNVVDSDPAIGLDLFAISIFLQEFMGKLIIEMKRKERVDMLVEIIVKERIRERLAGRKTKVEYRDTAQSGRSVWTIFYLQQLLTWVDNYGTDVSNIPEMVNCGKLFETEGNAFKGAYFLGNFKK
eukprot:TRINITY_DN6745_c0_g1_i2.p1 TRINITY_DN6745_c0_g1~~TRINITY_DN6745_c0_g1_i2.p1  ORF type:complete len:790 (-),score=94.38 TRINITY_DN6745_c0_g1_i2:17-2386(-)